MIIARKDVAKIAQQLKKEGKKIVTTNGCFDILHIGHAKYLAETKKLGDVLIVGVNADDSPYFATKPGRPIVPANERAGLVDSLKAVDYVFIFNEENPIAWIEEIKPDFHVKAADADYGMEQCVERHAVQKHGGKVVLLPKVRGKSTTEIVEKVLVQYAA